jgi:hypothetical protein
MRTFAFVGLLSWLLVAPATAQTPSELLKRELEAGQAGRAVSALQPLAARNVDARMALGFAQFVSAVERLTQGLYRFGLKAPNNPFLPVVRLPIPENHAAEAVDYAKLRGLYEQFLTDLATSRTTLDSFAAAPTSTGSKLVLDLSAVRLTVAVAGDRPTSIGLADTMASLAGGRGRPGMPQQSPTWEVAFDRADAIWLAGYSHIVSALFEFVMAHDWSRTFDATGHLFFRGAASSAQFGAANPMTALQGVDFGAMAGGVVDQIALLHLMQWPAGDKVRLGKVRQHLKDAVTHSRDMWKAVLAETDDDREWLPSPKQQSRAVPSLPISDEMVTGWLAALDDFDALLDGRKLLGHWRFQKGIDLRMVFDNPQPFDLVLWITGHAAMPYLKDGPTVDGTFLRRWNSTFGNNFLGYAFFIN